MSSLLNLESLLGYRFNNVRLLRQALTHRSYGRVNNERLEFVGDGILDCVIALNLFDYYQDVPEGQLSKMRAALVNQDSLLEIAQILDLGHYLYLGDGELKSGGRSRPSILADALEAIFAAVMLDSSFTNARYVIEKLFNHKIKEQETSNVTDYKTQLQEYLQSKRLPLPIYKIVSSSGPEHDMLFTIECAIERPNYKTWGEGRGKKQASQNAAQNLLAILKEHDFNE